MLTDPYPRWTRKSAWGPDLRLRSLARRGIARFGTLAPGLGWVLLIAIIIIPFIDSCDTFLLVTQTTLFICSNVFFQCAENVKQVKAAEKCLIVFFYKSDKVSQFQAGCAKSFFQAGCAKTLLTNEPAGGHRPQFL